MRLGVGVNVLYNDLERIYSLNFLPLKSISKQVPCSTVRFID
jgi:hypothetical protein